MRAVCCSDDDDSAVSFETIHFREQLVQGLFTLVVASTDTCSTLTTDSIDDLPADSLLYMYYNTPVNQNLAGYNQVGTVLDVAAELEVEQGGGGT